MTYAKNSAILAADYNAMAGVTSVAAANSAAATKAAGYLWGVGYGDRGYGETLPLLTNVSADNTILAIQWVNLRSTINDLASHQGTSLDLLPEEMAAGDTIVAHRLSTGESDLLAMLELVDENRFNYDIENMTLTSDVASTTRETTWGTSIEAVFEVVFSNENAARYFFNSGGDIRISLSHSDTSTPKNSSWNAILDDLTIAIKANSSERLSGSFGSAANIGYYQLTTDYQTILDGTYAPGSGAYLSNDFVVEAKAASITGLNGARGSTLNFRITLTDEHSGVDVVNSGTTASIGHLRATNLPNRPAPTCSVLSDF